MDYREQAKEIFVKLERLYPQSEVDMVRRAFEFSEKAHEGQKRKSGEPYIIHPVCVASLLAELSLDPPTVAAGFLHDCVEDVEGCTVQKIAELFGAEVAQLVDGVTKLSRLDFSSKEDQQAESLRKLFIAMGKDLRVVPIKLCDRLHNMRTLKFQPPERQKAIAKETLDVYAPLAHRLGIYAVKWEMEDLCLRYIDPDGYYQMVNMVGIKRKERENIVNCIISQLREKMDAEGIKCEITGRPKHFYSIYKKMKDQGKSFDQIYDLFAVRILVNTKEDCYAAMGYVHSMWKPIQSRIKDYIAMPKGNMYQSIHTTVVGSEGELKGQQFEIQIRTFDMHRTAEYGIAAHWHYKDGQAADNLDEKLQWLRSILDWQSEIKSSSEFMDALRTDLFSDEIYVLTPRGRVINLPINATPVDFAYRIHTDVGHKCMGANVNGKHVPLNTVLNSGDTVEIITGNNHVPSQDWLKFIVTSEARSKINSYLKHELHDENYARGKDSMEREAKRLGYDLPRLLKNEYIEPMLRRYSMTSLDDVIVSVGFGALSAAQILNKLNEEYKQANKLPEPIIPVEPIKTNNVSSNRPMHASSGILIQGDMDMPVRYAKCCNPVPGDRIIGFITKGRGVSVHRCDCTNMDEMRKEPERFIGVEWQTESGSFEAGIRMIVADRMGMLADITTLLFEKKISINSISSHQDKTGNANSHTTCIDLTLSIHNVEQLEDVISALKRRSDIFEVFRTNS